MLYRLHLVPDLIFLLLSVAIQIHLSHWALANPAWRSKGRRSLLLLGNLLSLALLTGSYLLGFQRSWRYLPSAWGQWLEAGGLVASLGLIGLYLGIFLWRAAPEHHPMRRRFLQGAGASLAMAPYVATTVGIISRDRFIVNEINASIPNLPRDLDGVRMVQITDIHLSPFLSESEFARAIDMANETRAHVALVTGDLISRFGDPLDACLFQLGRLRAEAGVLGCLGNHETYTNTEAYVTAQGRRIGIDFLRDQARLLQFGNATINFAGVDYQQFRRPYLANAGKLVVPNHLNILLSHNPDVFPVAANQGYDLTIAGHTHGGQVNFEILHENVNVARYYTRFVRGLYRVGNQSIWVGSGLGTIGVPVRLGAPPEIAVIRLCAS